MKKDNKNDFILKSNNTHNNKYDYSLVEYKKSKTKVEIICQLHGVFKQRPNDHIAGQGCPDCKKLTLRNLKIFSDNDFIENAKKIHGERYNYEQSKYNGTDVKTKIICAIHGLFEQCPHNHLRGQGCPKCKFDKIINNGRYTKEIFIEKSMIHHTNKYDYSLVNYKNNKTKIEIICPTHGIFKQRPIGHMRGEGCPTCNESKGEKIIREYLNENNIQYIAQKRFKDCKYKKLLSFDFYLNEYDVCIEYDGEQHFNPIETFGGIVEYEKCVIKDNIKTEYCKEKNIKLIRISFIDYNNIEKILNEQLKYERINTRNI